jgi:ABC-2 type transport system permease protein
MRSFVALVRKQVLESRWTLLISFAALFGLGWLYVFVTSLNEAEIFKALSSEEGDRRFRWMQSMGVMERPSTASIIAAFWNSPLIEVMVIIWAIGRGSGAVGAEVERGTLDLILSRPVSRSTYLASQVLVAVVGLAVLAVGLPLGAIIGSQYNFLREPPTFLTLLRPAVNLAALGLPIFGYTLLVSALDHVRWRATTIGSVVTLAMFIARVVSVIPVLQKYRWRDWLDRITIFKLYNPVDAVGAGAELGYNLAVLSGTAAVFIALAFVGFARRDLPASG